MKDLLLNLVSSYENRVETVESLILDAGGATTDSNDGLSQTYETRERLRSELRETLVRNCSLRRKDFDVFTSKIFADIDTKRAEIEEERKVIREKLRAYLRRQKELIISLKEELARFTTEDSAKHDLETILGHIKESQTGEGEQTFALLRVFQFRLRTFQQEQEELNSKLQRILERGELLRLEDFRHLRASLAHERRKAQRQTRKEDVERLLVHFNMERQQSVH